MCIVQRFLLISRALLLAALCLAPPAARALDPAAGLDTYRHERWGELDGAPRFVDAIAQTEDGWLWLATRQAGLMRFDGVRFHRFVAADGSRMLSESASVLRPGPDGALWIGHGRGGVTLLRKGRYTRVMAPDASGSVFAIAIAHDGAAWIAGWRGLFRIDGARVERIGADRGFGGERAQYVLADRAGRIWATDGASLYLRAPGAQRFERVRAAGPDSMLLEDNLGGVWLVLDKRFERVAAPTAGAARPSHGRSSSFQSLFDANGNLWSGNCPVGLCVQRPAAWQALPSFTPVGAPERLDQPWQMTSLTVVSMMEDRDGSIWVGTPTGLERFRDQVVTMDPQRFDRGVVLPALHPDGGIRAVQVRRYDGVSALLRLERGRALPQPNPLGVRALDRGPDGSLVLAGDHGLERHRADGVERIPLPEQVREAGATARIQDLTAGNRDIWIWTGHLGVWHYLDGHWTRSALDQPSQPMTIAVDGDGRSYFGHRGNRVRIVDGGAVREYGAADGVDVGAFELIAPGERLVISGEKGMQVLRGRRFRTLRFALEGGLGIVSGMVRDADGNQWLNAERGLYRVAAGAWERSLANPELPLAGTLFDALDGYVGGASTIVAARAAVAAPDGTLWFAGERGLASVDPRKIVANPVTPDVHILSLGAHGQRYSAERSIRLPEGAEDVQIDYTSPSLRMPQRVRFRYRLGGEAWVDAGARRTAFFQRLRPGDHAFEVQAFNESGVASRITTLRFHIAPRLTQTWWFLAACALATLMFAALLYRLRTRQLAARIEDRFLARVHERESIARTLHDTFLQSVQGMLFSLQAATTRLAPGSPVRAEFERLLENARGVLVEGRDEIQGLRENFADGRAFRDALMRDLDTAVPGSLLRIEATGPDLLAGLGTAPLSRDLYAIVREAMINALQHTAGKVVLRAEPGARQLLLTVRDCGPGLGQHAESKPGHFGLQGMRERAAQIGARLRIESDSGGTTVTIAIPVGAGTAQPAAMRA